MSDLLAQLCSADSLTRFRAACALDSVVAEHPEWVRFNLLQALRYEQDPRVLGRLLPATYRYSKTAPHDLLDALEECFVLRWDQVFRKATGMALVVLSALTGAKQGAERAFHLLPQRPDIFETWQQAFFSEILAFAWWGCAEHVPQAYRFLSALTRPDLAKIGLWHAFGESSSVREKKNFDQSSQREGCLSHMVSLERILELMGLKKQEEVGSGSTIVPPLKGLKW